MALDIEYFTHSRMHVERGEQLGLVNKLSFYLRAPFT